MRAYKFRMYLTKEQQILINKTFGCTRFIYNYFLAKKQEQYKATRTSMTAYECCKEVKDLVKEYPWLSEIDSCALRCAIFNLDNAFKNFYKKRGNYPNFKKKFGKASYRTNCITSSSKGTDYANIRVDLINNMIKLPKLKQVKIRGYRNLTQLDGRIINATISKDASNRYYVSVIVEGVKQKQCQEIPNNIIGIDLGIKTLLTTSDGVSYDNRRAITKYEQRIKRMQRSLSRKQRGSNNYAKAKQKLGVLYRKLRNTRSYYLHKISKTLTDTNKVIVAETLNIKNMIKNHKLAKAITDASWYELIRQLKYKSGFKENKFYQIETKYASSQICSVCDHKNKEVTNLKVREWQCDECGNNHDRDINAAVNIMTKGLEQYIEGLV